MQKQEQKKRNFHNNTVLVLFYAILFWYRLVNLANSVIDSNSKNSNDVDSFQLKLYCLICYKATTVFHIKASCLAVLVYYVFFLKFLLEDISPYCGATDTPVLVFWWHLSWVSKPGWLHHRCATDFSDSPLVRQLLTSWQLAWRPSRFDPGTCLLNLTEQQFMVFKQMKEKT